MKYALIGGIILWVIIGCTAIHIRGDNNAVHIEDTIKGEADKED